MKQLIIDRFEGNYAVIEYGNETFDFPKVLLPGNAKEGDVLTLEVSIDTRETNDRKQSTLDKMNRLRKKKD